VVSSQTRCVTGTITKVNWTGADENLIWDSALVEEVAMQAVVPVDHARAIRDTPEKGRVLTLGG
jgi:hypothetical protein